MKATDTLLLRFSAIAVDALPWMRVDPLVQGSLAGRKQPHLIAS